MTNFKKQIPVISKIKFDTPGKIAIHFEDGRVLTIPVSYFPELKKLSVAERKKYTIVDDRTILFKNVDTVYHLEDFVGLEENWRKR